MKSNLTLLLIAVIGLITIQTISQNVSESSSPSEIGKEGGYEFKMPPKKGASPQEAAALRIDRYELQVLSKNTQLGNPGDRLLTISGAGFYLTATSPSVVINGKLIFEDNTTNGSSTELYVILKEEHLKQFEGLGDTLEILVKKGYGQAEGSYAKVVANKKDFMDPQTLPEVSVLFRDGNFYREKQ